MTVVYDLMTRGDGRSPQLTLVELSVESSTGGQIRDGATGALLAGTSRLHVDGNGEWLVDLIPQSELYDPTSPPVFGDVFDVIDDGATTDVAWPGDLYQLPDGTWLAVWETGTEPFALDVWASEADAPMAVWSTPVKLSTTTAVDPWATTLTGSDVFVGWQGGPNPSTPGFSWVKRTSRGVWSAPAALFDEAGTSHDILEGTTTRIGSTSWLVYDRKLHADPFLWDLAVRQLVSNGAGGLTVGGFTTVAAAPFGPGMGKLGNQTRATICDSGDGGLLIVWAKDAGNGQVTTNPRSLYISRSDDSGATWSSPRLIFTDPAGKDVVNPFLVLMPDHTVRCYAYRDGLDPFLLIESHDGGDSWPDVSLHGVELPDGVQVVRLVARLDAGILYGITNAFVQTQVGVFSIDPPGLMGAGESQSDTWYTVREQLPDPVTYRFRVPEVGGPFTVQSLAF